MSQQPSKAPLSNAQLEARRTKWRVVAGWTTGLGVLAGIVGFVGYHTPTYNWFEDRWPTNTADAPEQNKLLRQGVDAFQGYDKTLHKQALAESLTPFAKAFLKAKGSEFRKIDITNVRVSKHAITVRVFAVGDGQVSGKKVAPTLDATLYLTRKPTNGQISYRYAPDGTGKLGRAFRRGEAAEKKTIYFFGASMAAMGLDEKAIIDALIGPACTPPATRRPSCPPHTAQPQ